MKVNLKETKNCLNQKCQKNHFYKKKKKMLINVLKEIHLSPYPTYLRLLTNYFQVQENQPFLQKKKKLVKILREIHLPPHPFKINLPVIFMRFQKSKKQFLQIILQKKREDKRQLPHRHPTTLLTMIRESDGSKKPFLSKKKINKNNFLLKKKKFKKLTVKKNTDLGVHPREPFHS